MYQAVGVAVERDPANLPKEGKESKTFYFSEAQRYYN